MNYVSTPSNTFTHTMQPERVKTLSFQNKFIPIFSEDKDWKKDGDVENI